jgi:hypothetical protein
MVRARITGIIGTLGGAAYLVGGLRMLVWGYGEDGITGLLGIVWALCWSCGAWMLLRLRVTGRSALARAAPMVLLAGFIGAACWGVHRLIDPAAADSGPFAIAPLLVVLGMLATGIYTIINAPWIGWRRAVPLLIGFIYIVTIAASVAMGAFTLPYTFALGGVGYVVLGNVIRQSGRGCPEGS